MTERTLTENMILNWQNHLTLQEKSPITIDKYVRDAHAFLSFINQDCVSKENMLMYKQLLIEKGYSHRSVNSKLASVNNLITFLGWADCKVKQLKLQKEIYSHEEKELSKAEYIRLLEASRKNARLCLIIETICSTGIRVSELRYFTVEAVRQGNVFVSCKNKTRSILIPSKLKKILLDYTKKKGITSGAIFCTRTGKPINRSNIWSEMKKLCADAKVNSHKVFPHNLRKLFARTFYGIEKDIAKLADILGHNSIETTRIYIMSTGAEHRRKIEKMGLVIPLTT